MRIVATFESKVTGNFMSTNNREVQPLIIQCNINLVADPISVSNGQFVVADSISELINLLKLHQTHSQLSSNILIVLHPMEFEQAKVSLEDFVSMIRAFCKCNFLDKPIDFAIIVHKPISRSELRSYKNLEIAGLVPIGNSRETAQALLTLSNGAEYWPALFIEQPAKPIKKNKDDQIKLTPRQSEVLSLVCNRGISNKKIAQMLNISESTVKVHMSSILKAYRVRNRTQLALSGVQVLSA